MYATSEVCNRHADYRDFRKINFHGAWKHKQLIDMANFDAISRSAAHRRVLSKNSVQFIRIPN